MILNRCAWAGVIWLSVGPVAIGQTATPSIEVFTDARHPVDAHGQLGVQIYAVDAISRFMTQLNSNLPQEWDQAEAVTHTALQRGQRHAKMLASSFAGLRRARDYGVDRVPAMVFDASAIVYGITDIGQALRRYQYWRHQARQP